MEAMTAVRSIEATLQDVWTFVEQPENFVPNLSLIDGSGKKQRTFQYNLESGSELFVLETEEVVEPTLYKASVIAPSAQNAYVKQLRLQLELNCAPKNAGKTEVELRLIPQNVPHIPGFMKSQIRNRAQAELDAFFSQVVAKIEANAK